MTVSMSPKSSGLTGPFSSLMTLIADFVMSIRITGKSSSKVKEALLNLIHGEAGVQLECRDPNLDLLTFGQLSHSVMSFHGTQRGQ